MWAAGEGLGEGSLCFFLCFTFQFPCNSGYLLSSHLLIMLLIMLASLFPYKMNCLKIISLLFNHQCQHSHWDTASSEGMRSHWTESWSSRLWRDGGRCRSSWQAIGEIEMGEKGFTNSTWFCNKTIVFYFAEQWYSKIVGFIILTILRRKNIGVNTAEKKTANKKFE